MSIDRFRLPHRVASCAARRACAVLALLLCVTWMPAGAQDDAMVPIAIPAQPDAIELGTGALPGANAQEAWHRQYQRVFARKIGRAHV